MSSQTSRTSSPHHLLYRLERKDDVMTVLHSARGRWLAVADNKVFTGLPYCHVYSHVVSWRARATRSCKWPNSPNFPSVVVVVRRRVRDLRRVGPGPGWLACQGYLSATDWLESGSCSPWPLYSVHHHHHHLQSVQ